MAICPECHGEGKVSSGKAGFLKFMWGFLLMMVLFVMTWLAHGKGKMDALEARCPPPPPAPPEKQCPKCECSCPEPRCLERMPDNCGRIGTEKVICTRNKNDRLRIGVETTEAGPFDPVFFYSSDELKEKIRQEAKAKEEKDGGQ